MSLSSLFSWGKAMSVSGGSQEMPEIFRMSIGETDFVKTDTLTLYTKILTDVIERTEGIPDELLPLLWDNCLQSESNRGLVTLLSEAISLKKDLFLIHDKPLKVLREAVGDEANRIREDYKKQAKSTLGIYVSFQKYARADMIKLYSSLEYSTVSSLSKNMNLSKAIQIKIKDLRGSVSLVDKDAAEKQAGEIAALLSAGKDIYSDSEDSIETAKPDLSATKEAMAFLDSKRSFYLGLPNSYITGEAPKGLGDSGQGETKAVDRGLKIFYFSIIKPVVEALFGIKTTFKPQELSQISTGLEALKTFGVTEDEYVSKENKIKILNKLFDLPEDATGDEVPEPEPALKLPPIPTESEA